MLDHLHLPSEPPEILRAAAPIAFDLDAEVDDVREAIGHIVVNAGAYLPWRGLSASETADAALRLARAEGISEPRTTSDRGREKGRLKVLVEALQETGEGEDDASPEQERTPSKRRDQEPEL